MKTVCRSLPCVLVIGVLATSVSFAEGEKKADKGKRPDCAKIYAGMDADKSGGVTLDEFKASRAKRMESHRERGGNRERPEGAKTPPTDEEMFSRMDADSDGLVTEEELKASFKQHRGPHGRHGDKKKSKDDDDDDKDEDNDAS